MSPQEAIDQAENALDLVMGSLPGFVRGWQQSGQNHAAQVFLLDSIAHDLEVARTDPALRDRSAHVEEELSRTDVQLMLMVNDCMSQVLWVPREPGVRP